MHPKISTASEEHIGLARARIGTRIRQLRLRLGISQGTIEQRTGLLRCYVSRVENGHTVPSLETLERFASALDIPLYLLFYEGDEPRPFSSAGTFLEASEHANEEVASQDRFLRQLGRFFSRMADPDRSILLGLAKKLSEHCQKIPALPNKPNLLPRISDT